MKNKKNDPEESLEKFRTDLSELAEIIGDMLKKNLIRKLKRKYK